MLTPTKVRFATLEWLEQRRLMTASPVDPSALQQGTTVEQVAVAPTFSATIGATGRFTNVTYNGVTYIDANRPGSTEAWLIVVSTDLAGNDKRTEWMAPTSESWDASTQTLVQNTPLVKLSWKFAKSDHEVSWNVTLENTTGNRKIVGYNLLASALTFSTPNTTSVGPPMVSGLSGGLQASRTNDGANAVYLVNDSPGTPHSFHFQQFAGSETEGTYRVRVGTAKLWGDGSTYHTDDPTVIIAPGQTDQAAFSLRFAPVTITTNDANPDLVEETRQELPFRLNWNDRRPIGAFWAHGGNNPLASVDTSTPAGVAQYQALAMRTAHGIVAAAQREKLQGIVFWDMEGTDQFRNANPYWYAGDPRLIATTNSAFNGVADQFFGILRNAGLNFGFTIRNSKLEQTPTGWHHNESAAPNNAQYAEKIAYAKDRWGAKLFYVDVADLHDISALNTASLAHPDTLLMPETRPGMAIGYNAFSAPLLDQRFSGWNTTAQTRELHPDAFSVVWVGDTLHRNSSENQAIMRAAVVNGDILMAHVSTMADITAVADSAGVPLIRTPAPPPPNPSTPAPPPSNPSTPTPPPTTPPPATPPPTTPPTTPPTAPPTAPPASGNQNPTVPNNNNPAPGSNGSVPPSGAPNTSNPSTSPPPGTGPGAGAPDSTPPVSTPPTSVLPTSTPPTSTPPTSNPPVVVGNVPPVNVAPSPGPITTPPPTSGAPTTPVAPSTPGGSSGGVTGGATGPSAGPQDPPQPAPTDNSGLPPIADPALILASSSPITAPVVTPRAGVVLRPRFAPPTSPATPTTPPVQSAAPIASAVVAPPSFVAPAPVARAPVAPAPPNNPPSRPATVRPTQPTTAPRLVVPSLAGLSPAALRGWSMTANTRSRVVAAAPASRPTPASFVAPVLTAMVRINPLAIANSPTLFSSLPLTQSPAPQFAPASSTSPNPLDSDDTLDVGVRGAA